MERFPKGRKENLIIQELADEILIYDQTRDKAHCLNQTAAFIWKRCDGQTSIAEISRDLGRELKTTVDEKVVWIALAQFARDQLLQEKLEAPPALLLDGLNRRQMIRAAGLAAIVAVPLVTSIVAPTPAQAATCLASGQTCTASAQCCSGLCNAGTCA